MCRYTGIAALFHAPVLDRGKIYWPGEFGALGASPSRRRRDGRGRFGRSAARPRCFHQYYLTTTRLWLAALISYAVTWGAPATASPNGGGEGRQEVLVLFDIPSQPLEAALDAYGKISGEQVLYKTSLTAGLRSAAVQGLFTPDAALKTLLMGTGLIARYTTADAYTLMAAPASPVPGENDQADIAADLVFYSAYLGGVQASILKAICQNDGTRPGSYQATLQFWIDPAGIITDITVVITTGDPGRDADILAALRNVAVGKSPPAGMPQPITMTISPKSPSVTGDCIVADSAGGGSS